MLSPRELTRSLREFADGLASDDRDRRTLNDFRDLSRDWADTANKVMAMVDAGNRDDPVALRG